MMLASGFNTRQTKQRKRKSSFHREETRSQCSLYSFHYIIFTFKLFQELWSLVDFVTEGKLLGTLKTFKTEFENPIVRVSVSVYSLLLVSPVMLQHKVSTSR